VVGAEEWAGISKGGLARCTTATHGSKGRPIFFTVNLADRPSHLPGARIDALRDAVRSAKVHIDYIYYNPVKHGHVARVVDGSFSSFHRHLRLGWVTPDWASREVISLFAQLARYRPHQSVRSRRCRHGNQLKPSQFGDLLGKEVPPVVGS